MKNVQLGLVFSILGLAACGSSDSNQPPPYVDAPCTGAACSDHVGSTGGPGAGGASGLPTGGGGGTGGTAPTVTLNIAVRETTSTDFASNAVYPTQATITADTGQTATWNGVDAVPLALPAGNHVLSITPQQTDFRPSLFATSVTADGELDVVVVDNTTLTTINTTLPMPGTFVATAPVAVVQLVDASGNGVSGATVALPNATATIAYGDSSGWGGLATNATGEVLLMNLSAATTQTLTITSPSRSDVVTELPVSFGATTFVAYVLP